LASIFGSRRRKATIDHTTSSRVEFGQDGIAVSFTPAER
jgi:hypothetical protein